MYPMGCPLNVTLLAATGLTFTRALSRVTVWSSGADDAARPPADDEIGVLPRLSGGLLGTPGVYPPGNLHGMTYRLLACCLEFWTDEDH